MQTQAEVQDSNSEKASRQTTSRPNDGTDGQPLPIWSVDVGLQIEELQKGRHSKTSNKIQSPHPLHSAGVS